MKGLKAQVSIFIGLGVLLLILVGINLYLMYGSTEVLDVTDYNPDALTPVERFITQCVQTTAEDAVLKLGFQGGYIYEESAPQIFSNPRNYIQPLPGGLKTPLWDSQGSFFIPTEESITSDIEAFVENEVVSCISQITSQPSISDFETKSTPQVTVELTDEAIIVFLDYGVQVTLDNRVVQYSDYFAVVDVNMRHILETAEFIAFQHRTDLIVPDVAMNMISLDPELPLGDIRFSCESLFWFENEVQERLQSHLSYMIPQIRIQGTNYAPFDEPLAVYQRFDAEWDSERVAQEGLPDNLPVDMYEYTQQFWQIPSYNFNGLQVGLSYDQSYGMNLNVNPSDGNLIEANAARSGSSYLRFICLNIFHFTYDVSFPFMVTVYDDSAFDGRGFAFKYALPANIDHNYPTSQEPRFVSVDALETNSDFCQEQTSEQSIITARDYLTGEYLPDVAIRYDCVKYYCDLGKTNTFFNTGIPELQSTLPLGCFNGFFIAEKNGYLREKVQIENPEVVELDLIPLKEFSFIIAEKESLRALDEEIFTAMIFVESQNYDFEQFAVYPSNDNLPETIQLLDIDETYSLEIMIFANDNFVGGYFANMSVSSTELSADAIYFFPIIWREQVSGSSSPEAIRALYETLENDDPPYREANAPQFR